MTLASALAFGAAVLVLGLTPGPVVVATVARALAGGLAPALGFVAGVAAVDFGYLLLAVFGLAAVAHVLGELFVIVKIAGGAYLIWLGVQLWRAPPATQASGAPPERRFWRSFAAGAAVDLGNPKIILFYAAFLPTFLDLDALDAGDIALAAAIVVGILLAVNFAYAWLAARARRLIRDRRAARALNRASGALMIGAGVWVATRVGAHCMRP